MPFFTLSVAKFLVNIPGWLIAVYLAVALSMAVTLLVQFLIQSRTPTRGGNAWLILLILFFPLMALAMVWPITLPFAIYALWREKQRSTPASRGFPVIRR